MFKIFSAVLLLAVLSGCNGGGGGGQAGFHNDQGIDALGNHRYEEAREYFSQALQMDPNDAVVWANMGVTLTRLEDYEGALEAYGKSRELDTGDPVTVVEVAALHYRLGRYEEAETGFRKAMDMVKSAPEFQSSLALALLHQGKVDEAQKLLDGAVAFAKKAWIRHGLVRYHLAAFALVQGDTERGLELFEATLKTYPQGARNSVSDPDFEVIQDDPRYQQMVAGWWKIEG